jgi:molybdate transport system substrate-binding protein
MKQLSGDAVMHRFAGILLALVILLPSAPAREDDKTLVVFAATSMKNALDDIDAAFTAKTGTKVSASYAGSLTLAKQIEDGALADIFVSDDPDCMKYAVAKKVIDEATKVNLLGNSLVLIAPKAAKIDGVTIGPGFDLAELAGDGKIATGDVKSVAKYARAALEKLGAWQAAEPKFVMAESERAALALVARGEAVLGIVYSTDAKVGPDLKTVGTFPADSHPPIIYPVAATATANPEAKAYLDYLRSSAAKDIFERYGFDYLIKPPS